MRALRIASATATAMVVTLIVGSVATGVSFADGDPVPSKKDVHEARAAVQDKADDVAGVRAQLVLANQRLQASAVAADHAAEAYNGARWEAQQARAAARDAQRRSDIAATDVERQRQAYGDALVASYEMAPGLTALNAIAQSDGIATVIDRTTTMHTAEAALDDRYDAYRAAATVADVATGQAEDTRAAAAA
ncbi:MAG: NlpC/P60 family protein, partial [Nocardioides sp.]|nr:NlpC/P60 family protein [Nocardioides sp.]